MFVLCLIVMIGAIGLAIDGGRAYMVKSKLNAAVDATCMPAARAVSLGATQAERSSNAEAAARKYFAMNMSPIYLGAAASLTGTQVTFNGHEVTIRGTASATMPTTLMALLGHREVLLASSCQILRRGMDLAFVMDSSGSTYPSLVADQIRAQQRLFLRKLSPVDDRLALIEFSTGAVVHDPIRTVAQGFDLNGVIGHIRPRVHFGSIPDSGMEGGTNNAEGLWHARDQLNKVATAERSTLRVIVLYSHFMPNAFSSQFIFKDPARCLTSSGFRRPGTYRTEWSGAQPYTQWAITFPERGENDPTCHDWYHANINALADAPFPQYYNAHPDPLTNANSNEFPLVPSGPRIVYNSDMSIPNMVNIAANLAENIAAKARSEGIVVFTVGLGPEITTVRYGLQTDEHLKCLANSRDARASCRAAGAGQPVGMYCYAATVSKLPLCYDKFLAALLRLNR